MAIGLRKWSLIAVGVSAVLGVALLPPRDYAQPNRSFRRAGNDTPEAREYDKLRRRVARINELQLVKSWADSLAPLLVGQADRMHLPLSGVPADSVASYRETLERHLRPLAGVERRVKVGVFKVQKPRERVEYGWIPNGYRYLIGIHEGQPFCILADVGAHDGRGVGRSDITRLENGPCRLYAQYGVPGSGTEHWLRQSLYNFALADTPRLEDDVPRPERRAIFGLVGRSYRDALPLEGERCLAGVSEACLEVVLDPVVGDAADPWWRRRPERWIQSQLPHTSHFRHRGSWSYGPRLGSAGRSLIFHLEEEFGAEAFARFWRSDDPMLQAFEAAFGLPMEQWVMGWAQRYYGTIRAGPAVPPSVAGLSLLSVLLLGAVAGVLARRRTVS